MKLTFPITEYYVNKLIVIQKLNIRLKRSISDVGDVQHLYEGKVQEEKKETGKAITRGTTELSRTIGVRWALHV